MKIKQIYKICVLVCVALLAVGCTMDASEMPEFVYPEAKPKLPPSKTIPIKRKKPTLLNPSPRPLSASEYSNTDNEYEEYEEQDI